MKEGEKNINLNDDLPPLKDPTEKIQESNDGDVNMVQSTSAGGNGQGTLKRRYDLICRNIPKHDDRKKFAKYLDGMDLNYSRLKKPSGVTFAVLSFDV